MSIGRLQKSAFFLLLVFIGLPISQTFSQPVNFDTQKQTMSAEKDSIKHTFVQQERLSKNYYEDKNIDRIIGIAQWVTGVMAVAVAIITLIFIIAIAIGFFEYRRWKEIREEAQKSAKEAKETTEKIKRIEEEVKLILDRMKKAAEEEVNKIKSGFTLQPITETPPEELKEKLDELARKFEFYEALGLQLKPEDYFYRGNDFYYKGKFDLALKAFNKAIEFKPDDAEVWNNKGAALDRLGRWKEALKAYDRAIELKPDYASTWYNKGVVLGKLGHYEEALKAYDKAIELKPDYAIAWVNKGVVLGKLGHYEEELKAYDKAIELKPDYASAWYNKACYYSLKGDKENALKNLLKAIELDAKYKEEAKKDKDFKNLWDDEDFKKVIG